MTRRTLRGMVAALLLAAICLKHAGASTCVSRDVIADVGQQLLDRVFLTDTRDLEQAAFLTARPDGSLGCVLWPATSEREASTFHGEMPPMPVVGLPDNLSRPTVSDVSVIRHWIAYCLGATPPPVGDGGTATDARAQAPDGGADSEREPDSDDRGQTLARSAQQ